MRERWKRVKELAEQGYSISETARELGIHHTTAIYIGRKMGFQWKTDQRVSRRPTETVGRVERMMRLAAR